MFLKIRNQYNTETLQRQHSHYRSEVAAWNGLPWIGLVLVLFGFLLKLMWWPSLLFLTDYWGGWACFTVSILVIGLLTGIIGDVASGFGCTIGMKDAVTALTFVALGTSLPGRYSMAGYQACVLRTPPQPLRCVPY